MKRNKKVIEKRKILINKLKGLNFSSKEIGVIEELTDSMELANIEGEKELALEYKNLAKRRIKEFHENK